MAREGNNQQGRKVSLSELRDPQATHEADASTSAIERLIALIMEQREDIAALRQSIERKQSQKIKPGFAHLKIAASEVGYSPETVRLWAAKGEIEAERIGGVWLVNLKSVRERAERH